MIDWQSGLYILAVMVPLIAFFTQMLAGRYLKEKGAYLATGAIGLSFLLSLIGFIDYFAVEAPRHPVAHDVEVAEEGGAKAAEHSSKDAVAPAPAPAPAGRPLTWKATFDWVELGQNAIPGAAIGIAIPIEVHIDGLAVVMFLMVSLIATLIHVYSMGYMHGDPRYPRFFMYLSLFCFSMLALLASANLFMVFMCWELVGVCSYLLIGFWYEEKNNSDAANKAFIVNRVGDVGMLLGLGLLFSNLGVFNIAEINRGLRDSSGALNSVAKAGEGAIVEMKDRDAGTVETDIVTHAPKTIPYYLLTLAGLGVFAGCVGKSAQFPLHVWLPDAMAGPTPVSALIHAATMVAAGVYLVGRFFPLFTPEVLLTIAYAGGITLFIAATIAMVQVDYKKVLAYSTVSQLGFMMLALGVGGWSAGLFHLITHAFFKALLFLCAGSVYHSVHTYNMLALGGLYPKMKRTAICMLIGTMAISGVPLFSGFYSKDAILASSLEFVSRRPGHFMLFVLPAVGAMITAFYMFRLWLLVFSGTSRSASAASHGHDAHAHDAHGHDAHGRGDPVAHAHESPAIMTIPLVVLAAFSVFVGWPKFLFVGEPVLEEMLIYSRPFRLPELEAFHWYALASSLVIATAGIGLAFAVYSEWRILDAERMRGRFSPIHRFLAAKWYFDEAYQFLLVGPTLRLARILAGADKTLVDGVVNRSAGFVVATSRLDGFIDKYVVDKLVNLFGGLIYRIGDRGRMLQTGRLRSYLMVLTFAVCALFAAIVFWIGG